MYLMSLDLDMIKCVLCNMHTNHIFKVCINYTIYDDDMAHSIRGWMMMMLLRFLFDFGKWIFGVLCMKRQRCMQRIASDEVFIIWMRAHKAVEWTAKNIQWNIRSHAICTHSDLVPVISEGVDTNKNEKGRTKKCFDKKTRMIRRHFNANSIKVAIHNFIWSTVSLTVSEGTHGCTFFNFIHNSASSWWIGYNQSLPEIRSVG